MELDLHIQKSVMANDIVEVTIKDSCGDNPSTEVEESEKDVRITIQLQSFLYMYSYHYISATMPILCTMK